MVIKEKEDDDGGKRRKGAGREKRRETHIQSPSPRPKTHHHHHHQKRKQPRPAPAKHNKIKQNPTSNLLKENTRLLGGAGLLAVLVAVGVVRGVGVVRVGPVAVVVAHLACVSFIFLGFSVIAWGMCVG